MQLKDWLSILIPAGVTIIGLIVNHFATKSNIKNEMNFQQRSIHNIGKYVNNFNEYLKSKDFEGMTKEWKKIQNNLKSIIPLENILKQVRQTENIYNLIKNNGNNFDLSKEELEIIQKL